MGAERDPAGPGGSDLTEETRRERTDGGASTMGDPGGSAEVRTGMHSGRGAGDEYSGLGFAEGGPQGGVRDRVLGSARTVADSVRERAGGLAGSVRDGAGTLGQRATQARERLGELSERTNRALEQRGLLARLQDNPLPTLGIAFGIGFLLAGGGRSGGADTPAGRARRELRSALMAGLTAGAAQATRGFLQSTGGPDGLLGDLAGRAEEGAPRRSGRGSRGRMSGGLADSGAAGRPPSHREDA